MKTKKIFCNSAVILFLAGLSIHSVSAQTTKKEQVTKVYNIAPTEMFSLTSGRSEIEILTWDKNEIKITGDLTYKDEVNKEDIEKLLKAFKNLNVETSKNVLKLNLDLIKSSVHNINPFRKSRITTTLHNGDEISLDAKNIKTVYTIWIPETLTVQANVKFGKLKMASIKGNVDFSLHNSDLEMKDFGESGTFEMRFSKATMGSGGMSKFEVYNSEITTTDLKNVVIESRFSKINVAKADDVSIELYNGSCVFGKLNNITASVRFSDIHIKNKADKAKFNFDNSKLFGENFQFMEISEARFSEIKADDIGDTKIISSHNSTYHFTKVNTIACQESRFSKFTINEVVVNASFPYTHNSDINIISTSDSLNRFSGNFKFSTINLKLHPNLAYHLNYDATFGSVNIPTGKFKAKLISDKSDSKTTIHGSTSNDAKCTIDLVASNTNCKIE